MCIDLRIGAEQLDFDVLYLNLFMAESAYIYQLLDFLSTSFISLFKFIQVYSEV